MAFDVVGIDVDTEHHTAPVLAQIIPGTGADTPHAEHHDRCIARADDLVTGQLLAGLQAMQLLSPARVDAFRCGVQRRGDQESERKCDRQDRQPLRVQLPIADPDRTDDQTEFAEVAEAEGCQGRAACAHALAGGEQEVQQDLQRQDQQDQAQRGAEGGPAEFAGKPDRFTAKQC